jgi:Holliday junction resolvase RusA-like endonuclease
VSWSFVLPSQPPSWNHSYKIVTQYRQRRDGGRIGFSTLAKLESVVDYQQKAALIIRSARPSHWQPEGQLRIVYRFFLTHDVDCDNLQKAINDAIESATSIDDSRYLPCVQSKLFGVPLNEARVEVDVIEVGVSPSLATTSSRSTPNR